MNTRSSFAVRGRTLSELCCDNNPARGSRLPPARNGVALTEGGQHGESNVERLLGDLVSVGHEAAWSQFLELYSPVIFRVVRLFEYDADHVGDCFLFVCEKLSYGGFRRLRSFRLDGPARFSTWLAAVVRNLCLDWRRQKFGRQHTFESMEQLSEPAGFDWEIPDGAPGPEALAIRNRQREALSRALGGLPAQSRLLVRLRFERDLTLAQVARLTGLKDAQTADRRLREVLEDLRDRLD